MVRDRSVERGQRLRVQRFGEVHRLGCRSPVGATADMLEHDQLNPVYRHARVLRLRWRQCRQHQREAGQQPGQPRLLSDRSIHAAECTRLPDADRGASRCSRCSATLRRSATVSNSPWTRSRSCAGKE